jgi:heat shock protein HtpX
MMNEDEIEGVVAHEMAHVLNGDMVTMALVQGILNTFVVFFSRIIANIVDNFVQGEEESTGPSWVYFVVSIVLEIIFGILASLVAMKFSRYREFRADYGSAQFVGKRKMIAALKALQTMQNRMVSDDNSKLASMKISTKNKKSGLLGLFSSHPDLSERIQALENANI